MTASGISFGPPRGMRDFYPEDMVVRNAVFRAWTEASQHFGFLPYDACVVESLDLLKRKAGEEIVDQIYAFKDKSGRDLALRPEMTPSLARMVAGRQGTLSMPLKWFTIAQCFRYERTTRGRKREHYQWNVDIVGADAPQAEAEVLAAAIHAMSILGLTPEHYRVHVSSRGLLTDLLTGAGIPRSDHEAAFLALDKRGKIDDVAIRNTLHEQGIDDTSLDLIFSLFEIRTLADVRGRLGSETPALRCMEQLFDLLDGYGLREFVMFDISVIRGLAYYTGIVFEAFDAHRQSRAIFGGGRYDNLLGDIGGKPASGVGLGFGDVVVADLLESSGTTIPTQQGSVTAVGYMQDEQQSTAVRIAATLRQRGTAVDLGLSSEKPKLFFTRCNKRGFAEAIFIGPDDVANGTVRIKTLATRAERQVRIDEIAG